MPTRWFGGCFRVAENNLPCSVLGGCDPPPYLPACPHDGVKNPENLRVVRVCRSKIAFTHPPLHCPELWNLSWLPHGFKQGNRIFPTLFIERR
jgi:hypothetical protein